MNTKTQTAIKGFLAIVISTAIIAAAIYFAGKVYVPESQKPIDLAKEIGITVPENAIENSVVPEQVIVNSIPENVTGSIDPLNQNVTQLEVLAPTVWQTVVYAFKTSLSMKIALAITLIVVVFAAVAVCWLTLQQEILTDSDVDLEKVEENEKEPEKQVFLTKNVLIYYAVVVPSLLFKFIGLPLLQIYLQKRGILEQSMMAEEFFKNLKVDNNLTTATGFKPKYYTFSAAFVDPSSIPEVTSKPGSPFDSVYKEGAVIGRGGQGKVYEATLANGSGQKVAIKKVTIKDEFRNTVMETLMLREAKVMKYFGALDPQHFVKFYDYYVQSDKGVVKTLYIVMELLEGTALDHDKQLNKESVAIIARELLTAIQRLHSANWRHRDIKPPNVFVTRDGKVKLIDLGLAGPIGEATKCGTEEFFPPEVAMTNIDASVPFDTFPVTKFGSKKNLSLGSEGKYFVLAKCMQYEVVDIFSLGGTLRAMYNQTDDADFNEMVDMMMSLEPWKRPTAASLLTHPFITNNAPAGKNIDYNVVKAAMGA